jgi:hypothetical protein
MLVLLFISSIGTAATIALVDLTSFNYNYYHNNNINIQSSNNAFGQQIKTTPLLPTNKITIRFITSQFIPLTNSTFNQLKFNINYKTNDASLIDTKINGIMRVSSLNGSVIKTSSFPNGFLLNQSGAIHFATSFTDKTIQTVKADIFLTDLNKIHRLSNNITRNVTYNIIK